VSHEEEWLFRAASLQAGDESAAPRGGLEEIRVDAGVLEPFGDRAEGVGFVAVARVEGDELCEDGAPLGLEGGDRGRRTARSSRRG
jgi:hypothetical protein